MSACVLVVEDDNDFAESLRLAIEVTTTFSVVLCRDGREALHFLETGGRPCIIFLDLMMPTMDGWQFCSAKAVNPSIASIPVIVLTAGGSAVCKRAPLHASAVLGKNCGLDALVALMREHCPEDASLRDDHEVAQGT